MCVIKNFLCYDIKQVMSYIISWNFMSQYVACNNYHSIPSKYVTKYMHALQMSQYNVIISYLRMSPMKYIRISRHDVHHDMMYVTMWHNHDIKYVCNNINCILHARMHVLCIGLIGVPRNRCDIPHV